MNSGRFHFDSRVKPFIIGRAAGSSSIAAAEVLLILNREGRMPVIHTETTIDAPYDRVCELLADTSLYPQWNPLFTQVRGRMAVGARIDVEVSLPEIKPFTVQAAILDLTPGENLSWRYAYPVPGLFSWTYRYRIVMQESQSLLFLQDSIYAGLLAPLYHLGMKSALQRGLDEAGKAVKRWSERRNIACLKC